MGRKDKSWNTNNKAKRKITTRHKCQICGKQYKQEWTCLNHEKTCKPEK